MTLQPRPTNRLPAGDGASHAARAARAFVPLEGTDPRERDSLRRRALDAAQAVAGFVLRATRLDGVAARNSLDYRVVRQETRFSNLPPGFEGFRILHLSDLHVDGIVDGGRRLLALLETLDCDLCVMTGDYRFRCSGAWVAVIELMEQVLHRIRSRYGVIGILGDHDSLEMAPRFEDLGMRVLLNSSTAVAVDGEEIWIAGVDGRSHTVCEVAKAMRDVPDGACCILLAHSPDCAAEGASRGADLCLAGHTHGGQLCLPFGIPVLTNAKCPRRLARGAWTVGSMRGFTSRGVGTSGLAARLFCPPELVLHDLRAEEIAAAVDTRASEEHPEPARGLR